MKQEPSFELKEFPCEEVKIWDTQVTSHSSKSYPDYALLMFVLRHSTQFGVLCLILKRYEEGLRKAFHIPNN